MGRRCRSDISRSASATASRSTTSPSTWAAARSSASSGRTAPARRPPCGRSARSSRRPRARPPSPGSRSRPENGVEIRRRIAIMPESPGLYLRLSVLENLECFADLYEVADPRDRIERALRAVNLADRARDAVRHAVQGTPPAGRPRPGAAQRPRSAVPRRADRGPRPGRRPGGPRADRRAPAAGRDDLPDDPSARGGRAALRPRRDPEHDPAHDRPARRAPRPAVRQDADGQDRSPRSPIPTRVFGGLPGRRGLAPGWRAPATS